MKEKNDKKKKEKRKTKARTKAEVLRRKRKADSDDDSRKTKKQRTSVKVCPKTLNKSSSPEDVDFNGKLYWDHDVPIEVVRRINSTVYEIIESDNEDNIAFGKRKI